METHSSHLPLLINTAAHATGALIFALSAYFLLRRRGSSRLSVAAAALALVYNLASLAELAAPAEWLVAAATSALSVMPAVLLHVALANRFPWLTRAGYLVAFAAVLLHALEQRTGLSHRFVLLATTVSFGALTAWAGWGLVRARATARLVAAMALFLFAMTLAHFGSVGRQTDWAVELVLHHAGIPLALVVLLQDDRFLLLDAYVRVLAGLALAAVFILGAARLRLGWPEEPFAQGLTLVGAGLALSLFAYLHGKLQDMLTRLVFRRPPEGPLLTRLREIAAETGNESDYFRAAAAEVAAYFGAALGPPAEASVEVRLGSGDARRIELGRRSGGGRYLSEDLECTRRIAAQMSEHIENFRRAESDRLMARAELRALEAQIQPHFLFNALNTLYGVIPRQAEGARGMVLNLADILRYSLRPERTFTTIEEELRVVEAYLEIEKLRLGGRLRVEMRVEPEALGARIPPLSLQSLVENAVKHAVASRPGGGSLTLTARVAGGRALVRVSDTGPGFGGAEPTHGAGVGLDNVRRRLELAFGPSAGLRIASTSEGATVEFEVPVERVAA